MSGEPTDELAELVDDEAADEDNTIPVQAVDTDDIVRRERLTSIFDAKAVCRETRRKAQNLTMKDGGTQFTANGYYRHAIETYVREAEALFAASESGRQYWRSHGFGSFTVQPATTQKSSFGRSSGTDLALAESGHRLKQQPPSDEISVIGLKALFEIDSPITAEFDVRVESQRLGKQRTIHTATVRQQIPFSILDQMYAVVNGYLGELGLDIAVETDESDEWDI